MWNVDKLYTKRNICIKIEKKQHMWEKDKENIRHLIYIYIYIYIKEYNVCNKSGHKTMVHVMRKNKVKNTLPISSISYASSSPNNKTTLIYKTTPHFSHEWQRVYHWKVVISSSYLRPKASSPSSSPPSEKEDSLACSSEGEDAKPPRQDWQQAMRSILMFI